MRAPILAEAADAFKLIRPPFPWATNRRKAIA
jgi:hypothetical protein